MIPLLLLAGIAITPIDVGEPVLDVRVADIDADGIEDIVAVTKTRLLLFRSGRGDPVAHPVERLTVVGKGVLGIVRDGRYRPVTEPFGAFKEGAAGAASLLAAFGRAEPRLLDAPGDIDGDGRADVVLTCLDGVHAPAGVLPMTPEARLEIDRNEEFAVEYRLPVPVVGNWSGQPRELVLLHESAVVSYHGLKQTDRLALPLTTKGEGVEAIRRNHVFLRDLDGDGRLDLVVVIAKGKEGLFGEVEATVSVWLGGRIYNRARKGFYRRAAVLKVDGALIAPALVDVDGDGDLDLVLSTIRASLLSGATGSAAGAYHIFEFKDGTYLRKPRWTHTGSVPMSAFQSRPVPPATFLPDLDSSGIARGIEIGPRVRLLEAREGVFRIIDRIEFKAGGVPAYGRRLAVVRGETGLLVIRGQW